MTTTMMYNAIRPVRILPKEGRENLVKQLHDAALLVKRMRQEGMEDCFQLQESLASYTTFGIGGMAQVMLCPQTEAQLQTIVILCHELHVEPKILGGGSKLLIVQEVVPVVLSLRRFREIKVVGDCLLASAGTSLTQAIKTAITNELTGLEILAGIPGTLGGALAGNAGSNWDKKRIDIGDFVQEVKVLTREGRLQTLPRQAIELGYRKSSLSQYVIVSAVLRMNAGSASVLQDRYNVALRQKVESQPLSAKSAGCIFKNPTGLAAWKLICEAGLSGTQIGDAMVSPKHANFIVNLGKARGTDVWELIQLVRNQVKQVSGIELSLEVKVW